MFGAYFFVSNERIDHFRVAYNMIDLVQDFGGVFEILWISFSMMIYKLNNKIVMAKFIRSLYFTGSGNMAWGMQPSTQASSSQRVEADVIRYYGRDKCRLIMKSLGCSKCTG